MSDKRSRDAEYLKQVLNVVAGQSREVVNGTLHTPDKDLWGAVVQFAVRKIIVANDLLLLDDYTCTAATVTKSVETDDEFAGTVTVVPRPVITAVFAGEFINSIFDCIPLDAKWNRASSFEKAVYARLAIKGNDGYIRNYDAEITTSAKGVVLTNYTPPAKPPSEGPDPCGFVDDTSRKLAPWERERLRIACMNTDVL